MPFFQIILVTGAFHPIIQIVHGAKQQARQGIESILSPKKQRRPLPFHLSLFFFYEMLYNILDVHVACAVYYKLPHI